MTTTDVVALVAILAVASCIVGFMLRDWFKKRRRIKALAARIQHDNDADFGRRFFPDPKRAEIAARVRRVLSKNLEMSLGGLTPSDRLDDDLNAELACNPHLFWDLDAEFGIKTSETLEAFENAVKRVVTFQDLVDFVESKMSEPRDGIDHDDEEESSPAYEFAMRSIPVLAISGLIITVIGIVIQKRSVINVGAMVFMLGIAVWGIGNGGALLWSLIRSFWSGSIKDAHPLLLILFAFMTLVFLWIGGIILWGILKNVFAGN